VKNKKKIKKQTVMGQIRDLVWQKN